MVPHRYRIGNSLRVGKFQAALVERRAAIDRQHLLPAWRWRLRLIVAFGNVSVAQTKGSQYISNRESEVPRLRSGRLFSPLGYLRQPATLVTTAGACKFPSKRDNFCTGVAKHVPHRILYVRGKLLKEILLSEAEPYAERVQPTDGVGKHVINGLAVVASLYRVQHRGTKTSRAPRGGPRRLG